jgi:TolA-binding protein
VSRGLTLLIACVALVAVALAGCGEKPPGIPKRQADTLIKLLRQAREQADDPEKCDSLQSTIRAVRARVERLPSKVDSDVRETLRNGVDNLASSAEQQCTETKTTPTTTTETTETVPTETTPTETTPTETTPTETTPTETTPTETTPTQPTTPSTPSVPETGGTGPGNSQPKRDRGNGRGAGYGRGDRGAGYGRGGDQGDD